MANGFGQALLELIDQEYETAEDALEDISEATGLEVDDILDLVEGASVPDADLTEALIEVFETTSENPEAAQGLLVLAEDAYEEALEANEALADEDEEGDYEDEDEDEEDYEDEEDDEDDESEASYSSGRNLGVLGDLSEIQDTMAEFQMQAAVNEDLDSLDAFGDEGINEGWLSPSMKSLILGSFKKDTQRLAQFSAVCEQNEVNAATQLYAINYTLNVLRQLGPMDLLNEYSEEEVEEAQFSASEEAVVEAMARGALDLYNANR
jgi:hypothetical protein